MPVLECHKDIVKELHIESMEKAVMIIVLRENYINKFDQELRRG